MDEGEEVEGETVTPAVKIHQDARGQWQQHAVQLQYSAPQPLDVALDKVREGRTVFVQPEDAAAVLDAAREGVGSGEAQS